MRNASLRVKITLLAVVIGGLGMLLFGVAIGRKLKAVRMANLDASLARHVDDFFDILESSQAPVDWKQEETVRRLFHGMQSLDTVEIEQPPGENVFRSRILGMRKLPISADGVAFTGAIGDGSARVYQKTQNGTVVRIAADLETNSATQSDIVQTFAIAVPTILVFIALGALWLTRKALLPVERIAMLTDSITASRLSERLPVPRVNDEIGRLTVILNRMMDRLQGSFDQSRRFAADASHELKTPLTIIRGEVDAALRAGALSPAVERSLVNIQEETGRLVHIVEGLLLLSQADAGKFVLNLEPLNLSDFLADILEDVEILAQPRSITVKPDVQPGIFVAADAHFLRQVLLNLFDNAIKYNRDEGRIEASLAARDDGSAYFRIGNTTGRLLAGEERQRIFDRFYRAEPSRERAKGGQGLGLSICEEILRAHNGGISLLDEPRQDWTTFEFHIPLAPKQT